MASLCFAHLRRCFRATKGIGRVQPVGWGDCADMLGRDELEGVKMPNGPGVDDPKANACLHYNEVCIRFLRVHCTECKSH
jgi:hypothetical protein